MGQLALNFTVLPSLCLSNPPEHSAYPLNKQEPVQVAYFISQLHLVLQKHIKSGFKHIYCICLCVLYLACRD